MYLLCFYWEDKTFRIFLINMGTHLKIKGVPKKYCLSFIAILPIRKSPKTDQFHLNFHNFSDGFVNFKCNVLFSMEGSVYVVFKMVFLFIKWVSVFIQRIKKFQNS